MIPCCISMYGQVVCCVENSREVMKSIPLALLVLWFNLLGVTVVFLWFNVCI